jgi:ribosomal protein S18 acetylase RimI-like enzyme
MRPLNVWRDLMPIADLIELCFGATLDAEGRSSVNRMRRNAHNSAFLNWTSRAMDSTSLPFSGYVWEDGGRIVGNVSLIPFHQRGKKIYLIANVATHPDYRRRGIAHTLTERAVQHARDHKTDSIWLHVREDNPGAIYLYERLGFAEQARRTSWNAPSRGAPENPYPRLSTQPKAPQHWEVQREWLERAYPVTLQWYYARHWDIFRPGLWNSVYRFMTETYTEQWTAHQNDRLLGALSWNHSLSQFDRLWAALPPDSNGEALTALLIRARNSFPNGHTLQLDYPAHLHESDILMAGFNLQRTLIWMKFPGATQKQIARINQ